MASIVHLEALAYIMDDDEIKSMDTEKTKNYLSRIAMQSKWEEVVRTYKFNEKARGAKITKSGDTALHIAVSDGQEEYVEELVKLITVGECKIQNERGNTPLHIAASMGNVTMCLCIVKDHPSLVGALNVDNETPLFLAAAYGKKDAFLLMHYICTPNGHPNYNYCRRNDGDTVLHVAIAREYFDLAFQIIRLYEGLVNSFNSEGFSPLHLLAAKPSAFKSGSHLSRFQKIIYYCIYVDELKAELWDPNNERIIKTFKEERNPNYPENYQTCINFIRLFRKTIISVIKDQDQTEETQSMNTGNAPQVTNRTHTTIDQRGEIKWADPENPVEPKKQTLNISNPGSKSNVDQGQGHRKFPINSNTCFEFVKLLSKAGSKANVDKGQGYQKFPANYNTCSDFVKVLSDAVMIVFGLGSTQIRKMREKKEKHKWSVQIMNELLKRAVAYEYEDSGVIPKVHRETDETIPYKIVDGRAVFPFSDGDGEQATVTSSTFPMPQREAEKPNNGKAKIPEGSPAWTEPPWAQRSQMPPRSFFYYRFTKKTEEKTLEKGKLETPFLIAAKNGVTEMVEKILETIPVAIRDTNAEGKNAVLLAAENRQLFVFQLLLKKNILTKDLLSNVDNAGNTAFHLAATEMLEAKNPCHDLGPALQMQWEIKWFEFVKCSVPPHFLPLYNKKNQNARDIFSESHATLVKDGGEWLTKTSQNCSVMGGLVATVAFATATAVPGGIREATGTPILENQAAFEVFAISSLLAMCSSVMSMAIFLSILMSRFPEGAFGKELPIKFLAGLTTLFLSILSMLVSFCAGHFFMLKDKLKHFAVPVYLMACMPLAFFAVIQLPLYCNLIYMNFQKVPYFHRKAEATE